MKYTATLLLILSFLGVSFFGYAFFEHSMHQDTANCAASSIDGVECPTSIVGMMAHHISALQTMMTTTPPSLSFLLLIASLLIASTVLFLLYCNLFIPRPELLPQRLQELDLKSSYSRKKFTSWLSLFELSPSIF